MADTSGVNLLTGKVNLSVPLGSISGPAGFSESVSLSYSTTGLLQQIKTWNQDAPTSTVGLGWSLEMPYIYRIGNGSLKDSFYLVSGGSVLPLLFCKTIFYDSNINLITDIVSDKTSNNIQGYSFVTQATSLLQIIYFPSLEYWLIRDGNGNEYRYGTRTDNYDPNNNLDDNNQGLVNCIRWRASAPSQPNVWIGSSIETQGQQQYVDVWHISKKVNQSGQQIDYFYDRIQRKVGKKGEGLFYTVSIYLKSIKVVEGGRVDFQYGDKELWEYRPLKTYDNQTNAFQDRYETKFLSSVEFYDAYNILQYQRIFGYDFLYNHFNSSNLNDIDIQAMNKRLLVYIDTLTGAGVRMVPPQEFDYWGLYDILLQNQIVNASQANINGVAQSIFKSLPTSAFSLMNISQFGGNQTPIEKTRNYNALFGHLKNTKMSGGSIRWYSYSDNSLDYTEPQNPVTKKDWKLKLDTGDQIIDNGQIHDDLDFLTVPTALVKGLKVTWSNPKPYWGIDNYVVIQWNTFYSQDPPSIWICLQIYEWMGKWVPITCRNTNLTYINQKEAVIDNNGFTSDDLIFKLGLDPTLFLPKGTNDDPVKYNDILLTGISFSMGSGKFGLVRGHIEVTTENDNPLGTVTLFHRDLYMPGLWNSTYFSPYIPTGSNPTETQLPVVPYRYQNPDINSTNANDFPELYYPQIVIGNNIAGVLDVLDGNLYLYSLSNNQWFNYYKDNSPIKITNPIIDFNSFYKSSFSLEGLSATSAITAYGDDIFILSFENNTLSSTIFKYDITSSLPSTAWYETQHTHAEINIFELIFDNDYDVIEQPSIVGIRFLSQDNFITAEIIVDTSDDGERTYVSRPVAISWDQDTNSPTVKLQKIYSANSTDSLGFIPNSSTMSVRKLAWGSNITIPEGGNIINENGIVKSSSNLINISTSDGECRKYLARYVGGNLIGDYQFKDSNNGNLTEYVNIGWLCNSYLPNSQTSNDPFESFASLDTTVAINDHRLIKDYTYLFYQFNPYYGLSNTSVSDSAWIFQKDVDLGKNFDAQALFKIISASFNLAGYLSVLLGPGFDALTVATNIFIKGLGYGFKILDFVVNGPLNLAAGVLESQALSNIWRNSSSDATLGQSYLLSGTVEGSNTTNYPHVYYKQWNIDSKQWTWQDADPYKWFSILQNLPLRYGDKNFDDVSVDHVLSKDVYSYGANFIPFSFLVKARKTKLFQVFERRTYEDQIACLRNGLTSSLLSLPNFPGLYPDFVNNPTFKTSILKLPYTFYQPNSDNFSLNAFWGGMLLYQPEVRILYGPDIRSGYDFDSITIDFTQLGITKSKNLKLCMYQNENIIGPLSDFVVDKVSLDDGYQVYDTHLIYKSDRAIYQQNMNTVTYNQVNIATGGINYNIAAQNNGWVEQFFYNGSSPYTLTNSEKQNLNLASLPFDPATDKENPYAQSLDLFTNASIWLNPLFGQSYCQRLLTGSGYEMVRQYSYYTSYTQTVRDLDSSLVSNVYTSIPYKSIDIQNLNQIPQQTNGNVFTLKVILSAPDNTNQPYIQNLINPDTKSAGYLTKVQRMIYDLPGLRYLITYQAPLLTGYKTGLLMSQQDISNHYIDSSSGTPDTLSQLNIKTSIYTFQIDQYTDIFTSANTWLWSPVAQTIVSQTADAWRMEEATVAASATVWKSTNIVFQDQLNRITYGKTYWYPRANYRWVGNAQESYCTTSIPWSPGNLSNSSLVPLGTANDWQLDSYVRDVENGIVYNAVNVFNTLTQDNQVNFKGKRTTYIYDQYKIFPIASVNSTNLVDDQLSDLGNGFIRFCSFEAYEDLSNWNSRYLNDPSLPVVVPYNLQSILSRATYYAGEQSLCLTANGNNKTPILYWGSTNNVADTIESTPVEAILSFYARTDAINVSTVALNIGIVVQSEQGIKIIPTDFDWKINFQKSNVWSYQQIKIYLRDAVSKLLVSPYKLYFSFQYEDSNSSNVYIDTLSLIPYGSVGNYNIYDQQTKLLTAIIDLNGTISRTIYDSHRRIIGIAIGQNDDQNVVSCPVLYYSRENEKVPNTEQTNNYFNSDDPNSYSFIQAASGGQYFDFRTFGDLMGWSASNIDQLSVMQGNLYVQSSYAALKSFGPCVTGVAIRAQVSPQGGYDNTSDLSNRFNRLFDTSMGIQNNNNDKLSVTFNNNNQDEKYQFELILNDKTLDIFVEIPNIPATWAPDDWLLLLLEQSVYFFINGQLIIQQSLDTVFSLTNLQAILEANGGFTIGFSKIMLMQDPRLSTQYTDGSGKIRQTQTIADLPSPPSSID